jgi:hypothetical protein
MTPDSDSRLVAIHGWTVVSSLAPPYGYVVSTKVTLDGPETLLVLEKDGWLKLDTEDADETPNYWRVRAEKIDTTKIDISGWAVKK